MAPLADLVGITRQTAVLAFQFGELTTAIIPTSGITVGVLALSGLPYGTWVRWMLPLQPPAASSSRSTRRTTSPRTRA